MDVRRMLSQQPPSAAAAWACTYLQLVPRYAPAGAAPLWGWLRQAGLLGVLLGCAASAASRRWGVAGGALVLDAGCALLQCAASEGRAVNRRNLAAAADGTRSAAPLPQGLARCRHAG